MHDDGRAGAGDLGRRMAARRRQLGLSRGELAAQAGGVGPLPDLSGDLSGQRDVELPDATGQRTADGTSGPTGRRLPTAPGPGRTQRTLLNRVFSAPAAGEEATTLAMQPAAGSHLGQYAYRPVAEYLSEADEVQRAGFECVPQASVPARANLGLIREAACDWRLAEDLRPLPYTKDILKCESEPSGFGHRRIDSQHVNRGAPTRQAALDITRKPDQGGVMHHYCN